MQKEKMADIMLRSIPESKGIGNTTLQEDVKRRISAALDYDMSNEDYWDIRQILIDKNIIKTGRGRGGSVRRTDENDVIGKKPLNKHVVYTNGNVFEIRKGKSDDVVDTYKSVIDALKEVDKLNGNII
ncbi:MAG TPA: hypothetical protein VMV86_06535 [Methanosarcinales archaeon]|nr:hypothetical protein [Methanosarcinales archaeon]